MMIQSVENREATVHMKTKEMAGYDCLAFNTTFLPHHVIETHLFGGGITNVLGPRNVEKREDQVETSEATPSSTSAKSVNQKQCRIHVRPAEELPI